MILFLPIVINVWPQVKVDISYTNYLTKEIFPLRYSHDKILVFSYHICLLVKYLLLKYDIFRTCEFTSNNNTIAVTNFKLSLSFLFRIIRYMIFLRDKIIKSTIFFNIFHLFLRFFLFFFVYMRINFCLYTGKDVGLQRKKEKLRRERQRERLLSKFANFAEFILGALHIDAILKTETRLSQARINKGKRVLGAISSCSPR